MRCPKSGRRVPAAARRTYFVVLRQCDCQAIRSGDGHASLCDKLQHFIENELFFGLKFRDRTLGIEDSLSGCQRSSPPHLIVQIGKCQQCLQSIELRRPIC